MDLYDRTIAVVGGDERECEIARLAATTGARVRAYGFPWPEAGITGVEADAWFALFAPAQTPQAAIDRLYGAVRAGLSTEPARDAFTKQGMTLALRAPAEVALWLPGEVAKWAGVIRAAGVVAE